MLVYHAVVAVICRNIFLLLLGFRWSFNPVCAFHELICEVIDIAGFECFCIFPGDRGVFFNVAYKAVCAARQSLKQCQRQSLGRT